MVGYMVYTRPYSKVDMSPDHAIGKRVRLHVRHGTVVRLNTKTSTDNFASSVYDIMFPLL